jgi:D-2-hydroxyacid dehydrogenase (NADP+)
VSGSAATPGSQRRVVGVLLPGDMAATFSDALARAAAAREGLGPVEVRAIRWEDTTAAHRAKSRGSRSAAWLRAHEAPLDADGVALLAGCVALAAFQAPVDLRDLAPELRFVQGVAAGVGPLLGALAGSGLRVCSAAGASSGKVAEFAMARLLAVWTDQRKLDDLQRARRWEPDEVDSRPVEGRSVLVVGTGGIGRALARRAGAFGLRVHGVRRRPELGAPAGFERVEGPDRLTAMLPEADAVVLAAPATTRTDRLIGADELARFRPGAVLCNVSRGSLVDEEAVVAALVSGRLGAAILDVTATEPLSRRSPLWRAPNTYLSPHVANSWTPAYFSAVIGLFVDNLVRDARGEPLVNEVDFAEGY